MSRVYNFSAGPAMLPTDVLKQAQDEMLDWQNTGMSVMEMSHRGKEFTSIAKGAEARLREILAVPANYKVLFLQGGATTQFSAIPLNLMGRTGKADYIVTGHWSEKAMKEAKRYGQVNVIADTTASGFTTAPKQADLQFSADASYVHYAPNETIAGVEFDYIPETGDIPLVADFSSTILSRPIDVSRFGVIYAGAQKNIGPSGICIVIVREDLLGGAHALTPSLLDWKAQAENDSMVNTPATYGWYIAGLVFDWLHARGGLAPMAQVNARKAQALYAAIDNSNGFYRNPVEPRVRSWMNVPFFMAKPELDATFLKEASAAGLKTLAGHKLTGGMRASLYNAMPEEGVAALIAFMQDFAQRYGD